MSTNVLEFSGKLKTPICLQLITWKPTGSPARKMNYQFGD